MIEEVLYRLEELRVQLADLCSDRRGRTRWLTGV